MTSGDDAVDEATPDGSTSGPSFSNDFVLLSQTYQSLAARYNTNFAIRWQSLALGLTAQGFVVGAASQLGKGRLISAIMLAIVILFIGVTTIVTGQRFELVGLADAIMLDVYEERLLTGTAETMRLHHNLGSRRRARAMLTGAARARYDDELSRGGPYRILNTLAKLGPNHWWAYAMLAISVAGAAVPLLGYFGQ